MAHQLLSEIFESYGRDRDRDAVKIKDPARVEQLLTTMISQGFDSLQVVTDFDHTLSRSHNGGVPCATCHWAVHHSTYVTEDYRKRSRELYDKYYPIEIDHRMTGQEKLPHMVRWYEEKHKNMLTLTLTEEAIQDMVNSSNIQLRDHTVEMLDTLHQKKVPVLVFSAGIGNVLEAVLRKNSCYHPNTIVVSNFMEFDQKGLLSGFQEPIIHVYNKNEKAVLEYKPNYFDELSHRRNVLLLGDALGDKDMCDGVSGPVLKVGFLNTKIEDRLAAFMDTFDIVLIDDQSMDFINALLARMSKH